MRFYKRLRLQLLFIKLLPMNMLVGNYFSSENFVQTQDNVSAPYILSSSICNLNNFKTSFIVSMKLHELRNGLSNVDLDINSVVVYRISTWCEHSVNSGQTTLVQSTYRECYPNKCFSNLFLWRIFHNDAPQASTDVNAFNAGAARVTPRYIRWTEALTNVSYVNVNSPSTSGQA